MTTRAPTPSALADAWIARYGQAVRDAAGRDGRLSRAEADRMTAGTPLQQEAADNVAAFFDRTGQQTVSAERFLAAERARIVDEAGRVAGRGNRVSLLEARLLPRDLADDARALRGAPATPAPTTPTTPTTPTATTATTLVPTLTAAVAGMTYPSESDGALRVVAAADPQQRPITPALLVALFGSQSAALGRDIFGPNNSLPPIAGRASEVRDAQALLSRLATTFDPADPASQAAAQRWQSLQATLQGLRDLTVVRFGEPQAAGGVGIDVGVFVVGRTADDHVVGFYTGAVET
jgi:hypothetical protein